MEDNLCDLLGQWKKICGKQREYKIFTPRADSEIFRILPPHKGQNYFEEAYFHFIKVGNKLAKLFCPKHNDQENCPLCNHAEAIYNILETDTVIKQRVYQEYLKWRANKYYICKGLDKRALKDGIKFWRIKHGVFDKAIQSFISYNEITGNNFSDPEEGCDLLLTVLKKWLPGSHVSYMEVSSIIADGPKVLCDDNHFYKIALEDRSTWKDVFKKKTLFNISYEHYLELIVQNKIF